MYTGLIHTLTNTGDDPITGTYDGADYAIDASATIDLPANVSPWFLERHSGLAITGERLGLLPEANERVTLTNNTENTLYAKHGEQEFIFEAGVAVPVTEAVASALEHDPVYAGKFDRDAVTPSTMTSVPQNLANAVQQQVTEAVTHTITVTTGANGSIDPSGVEGVLTVADGDHQAFTITPNAHYVIDDVLVDGVSTGPDDSYTFTAIDEDHTIAATFAVITHTVTTSAGANGSISPDGASSVNEGDNLVLTVTPDEGYVVDTVTVDGSPASLTDGGYTFLNVTADHTIAITFTTA